MKLVKYNNKEYYVMCSGELLRNEKNYLLDQLKEDTPCMGRYHVEYIKKNYNLTDYEYYLIVVCNGNEDDIPRCEFDGCNKPKKFNLLGITKKVPILALGCCEEHSRSIKAKNQYQKQKELMDSGEDIMPNIYKCHDRIYTEEDRKKRSEQTLKQVREGRHPWTRENSKDLRKRLIDEGKNPIVNMWRSRDSLKYQPELNIYDSSKMKDIEYVLCSERDSYKYRGDINETCYFYITMLSDPDKFKIGVTTNIYNRSVKTRYHGIKYINPIIMYSGTREIVSDLEYVVKKQFIKKVVLGTETYSIKDYNDILEFIKYQIKLID